MSCRPTHSVFGVEKKYFLFVVEKNLKTEMMLEKIREERKMVEIE